jgi:hypothetical protein
LITSRQIIQISEEWAKSPKIFGKPVNIYVNPGSSDIKDMYKLMTNSSNKEIRFFADAKAQKVFVADAMLIQHQDIEKAMGYKPIDYGYDVPEYYIEGMGHIGGGRIILHANEDETSVLDTQGKYNWSFLEKYISGITAYLEKIKKKYAKKRK